MQRRSQAERTQATRALLIRTGERLTAVRVGHVELAQGSFTR